MCPGGGAQSRASACPEEAQSPAPWPPHTPQGHGGGGLGAASAPHTARHSAPGRRALAFPRPISALLRAALPALIQSESCGRGDERLLGSARSRRARPPGGRGPTRPGSAEAAGLGLRGAERGAALRAEGGREAAATPPPPAGIPAAGRSPELPRGPGGGRSRVWGGDLGRGEGAAVRSPRSKMAPAGYPGAGL